MHYKRFMRYGDATKTTKAKDGEGHVRSDGNRVFTMNGKVEYEHLLLAQKALGRQIPKGVVVHHMNEINHDNHTPFNLVICPDQAYHRLLHKRANEMKKHGRCLTVEYSSKKFAKEGLRTLISSDIVTLKETVLTKLTAYSKS